MKTEDNKEKSNFFKNTMIKMKSFFFRFFKNLKKQVFSFSKMISTKIVCFFKKIFQKTKALIKLIGLKISRLFILIGSKISKFLKYIWIKIKNVSKMIYQKTIILFQYVFSKMKFAFHKTTLFIKFLIKKIMLFFKMLLSQWKKLKKATKVLIITILIITTTFSSVYSIMLDIRKNDLIIYDFLNKTFEGRDFSLNDTIRNSSFLSENLKLGIRNYEALYLAIENNYDYYLPYLKTLKFTKEADRDYIYNKFNQLKDYFNDYYSFKFIITNQLVLIEEDPILAEVFDFEKNVTTFYSAQKNLVIESLTFLDDLRAFILKYGSIKEENKLKTYLVDLQIEYAKQIYILILNEISISSQASDLKQISEKYDEFTGKSSSLYQDAFIQAYENYNAADYYKASSKYVYLQGLTGQSQIYAQAFYNFLSQESYN